MALSEIPDIQLVLVGDQVQLRIEMEKLGLSNEARIRIQHASEVVTMDEAAVLALKKKKDSSMRVAINLVKENKAQACGSAGNNHIHSALVNIITFDKTIVVEPT